MKPPSRRRVLPSRFLDVSEPEEIKSFRSESRRSYLLKLLRALRQQKKLNSELDFLALHKKVPKLSLLQLQYMIKFLRKGVSHRVYLQVYKQRREEQQNKAPTELWGDLAQKMTGVHEETISSAFSQMLVIASTEPCNLHHSDPPHKSDTQSPLSSGLRTLPLRLMPKFPAGSPLTATILPEEANKTPQTHGKDVVSSPSTQSTTVTFSSTIAEEEHSESQQEREPTQMPPIPPTPTTPKFLLNHPVSKSILPMSASSTVSSAAPSVLPDTDHPENQPGSAEQVWQYRPMGINSVDFEKIYKFLSNIILQKNSQPLTAMESAVLLDLVMSLPEELPLLDCKELQHHLLQVHTCLSTPAPRLSKEQGPAVANTASAHVAEQQASISDQNAKGPNDFIQIQRVQSTGGECVQKAAVTYPSKATESLLSAGDCESHSPVTKLAHKGDWATAGLCPLNPFMVPLSLLKRQ